MIYGDEISKPRKKGVQASSLKIYAGATGAVVGMISGALFAYFEQKKLLRSLIIGGVTGAVVFSVAMMSKKNK